MARMRWFIAGAVTAAGALAAAGQVRRMLGASDADELEPWDEPTAYEVYAVRYATMPDFPVAAPVEGAEPGGTLDIAMTFWVLKGPGGRTVLVDAGFYRSQFLKKRVADYTAAPALIAGD